MENLITCTKCGTQNSSSSKFCNNCGSMIIEHQIKQDIEKPQLKNSFFSIYKVGLIIFCVVGFFALIFPPVNLSFESNPLVVVRPNEFTFILNASKPIKMYGGDNLIGEINSTLLFIELLILLILSIVIQIGFFRLKKYFVPQEYDTTLTEADRMIPGIKTFMILGILSIILSWFPVTMIISIIFAILAITKSKKFQKEYDANPNKYKNGTAILIRNLNITGRIALTITFISIILFIILE